MALDRHAKLIVRFYELHPEAPRGARKLAGLLQIPKEQYKAFRKTFKKLRDDGLLPRRRKVSRRRAGSMEGVFRLNPKGFGFVRPADSSEGGEDLFVPAGHVGGALSGDRVAVRLISSRGRHRRSRAYEVVDVLERGIQKVVGTVRRSKSGGFSYVHPDGDQLTIPLLLAEPKEAEPGQKVVARIVTFPSQEGELPTAEVLEVLGAESDVDVETTAVIRGRNLEEELSQGALDEAHEAAAAFDRSVVPEGREDLTSITTLTIDPKDARDFDDAVSIEQRPGGGYLLGVHIADVASFVPEGSLLDTEAKKRSTSVYFPTRVLPMLPDVLSSGVCSLAEGKLRWTKSVLMTFDSQGQRLSTELQNSCIRSAKRLTYEEAEELWQNQVTEDPTEIQAALWHMSDLARLLEKRRLVAGKVDLDLPELQLDIDSDGALLGVLRRKPLFSHRIIELFMVEANEAVASALAQAGVPAIRRIHPSPTEAAQKLFRAFADACGQKVGGQGRLQRKDYQRLIDQVRGEPEGFALNMALLRSLSRAVYSPRLEGHFALACDHYCHFTSPIRRYPDLTVHRTVDRHLLAKNKSGVAEMDESLHDLAASCSQAERNAEAAEEELKQVLVLKHLKTRVGEVFSGVVVGVAEYGLFVQLPEVLAEGLLRFSEMGGESFDVVVPFGPARGQVSGTTLRLGDLISVRIAAVDVAQRFLDFVPTAETARKQPRARRKKNKDALHRRPRGLMRRR